MDLEKEVVGEMKGILLNLFPFAIVKANGDFISIYNCDCQGSLYSLRGELGEISISQKRVFAYRNSAVIGLNKFIKNPYVKRNFGFKRVEVV